MSTATPPGSDNGARIRELESEVARLRGEIAEESAPAKRGGGGRGRTALATVLIVIASLLAPLSAAAVWARGEVTDTDRYVATVAPLAQDPAIQSAVSNRISEALYDYLDTLDLPGQLIDAVTENRDLPPQRAALLEGIVPTLQSAARGYVDSAISDVVRSDQFAALWAQVNTTSHEQVVALLSGETNTALQLQGNNVVLDLGDVITEVKQRLTDRGFELAERIPTTSTQIVVFEGRNLAQLQGAYAALDALGFWLPLIVAAVALAGVLVARNRRRAVVGVGIGLTTAMLVSAVAVAAFRAGYLRALPETADLAAATAFFDTVAYFLRQALWAGAVAGAVLVLAGLLTGPSTFATAVRRPFTAAAAGLSGWLGSWWHSSRSVVDWVAPRAGGIRMAAVLLAVGFVLAQRYKTAELVLWTTVALLVALFLIQTFAGRQGGEPEEPVEESEAATA